MFRKVTLLGVVVLILAAIMAAPTLAAAEVQVEVETDQLRQPRRAVRGEILVVDLVSQSFQFLAGRHGELTIQATPRTQYRGAVSGLEDLTAGMIAGIILRPVGDTAAGERPELEAIWVFVPENQPEVRRYAGELQEIDLPAGTFRLATEHRGELVVEVDQDTQYRGVSGLSDLSPGLRIVIAVKENDGGLLAILVAVPQEIPGEKFIGHVVAVDLATESFDLQKRDGLQVSFQTNDATRFHSRGGQVEGLNDLAPGQIAAVIAEPQGNGSYLALAVGVTKPRLPRPIRVAGQIENLANQTIQVHTRDGDSVRIQVDENTHFRSPDGQVNEFGDLQIGDHIIIAAIHKEEGLILAKLIVVAAVKDNQSGN